MTPAELKARRYRMEVCITCGTEWNVSRKARLPKTGYICPHCRSRRGDKKTAATAAVVLGLVVFGIMCWLAYVERGYIALGGELVFLGFPLWGAYTYISLAAEYVIGLVKRQCRPSGSRAAMDKGKTSWGEVPYTLYHETRGNVKGGDGT